ncbi:MAG: error-prone DNA polymerase [Gammaproteobacteria bacterium]|nr:error-prone DNA polymerase [Gammaproteobacteria bacterium]
MQYAELICASNYSFLAAASQPEELVARADELGYDAIAITDECSLAGVVKAHVEAKDRDIELIIGSRFKINCGEHGVLDLVLLAPCRDAYAQISTLITKARRRSGKGHYTLTVNDLEFGLKQCLAIWLVPTVTQYTYQLAPSLIKAFPKGVWIAFSHHLCAQPYEHYQQLCELADCYQLPIVASNNVVIHHPERQPLYDVMQAIRLGCSIESLGLNALPNREATFQPLSELELRYPSALIEESIAIANQCHFSLDELRYNYPDEVVPSGHTPSEWLRSLVEQGIQSRWPEGPSVKVLKQIDYELEVIKELRYEHYFLTVHDLVQFARAEGILCQGRGSAANSAVCYCLFITEVDPNQSDLLFERFISKERNEPPDIDVDFEHHRREEVIQYIYKKYGRERAALAATVVTYRPRSAIRDVGKALGLDSILVDKLAKSLAWWDRSGDLESRLAEANLSKHSPITRHYATLIREILGMPRHLSQHVGGFIITQSPVSSLVPIENAAMPDRTIIQWDKDDIEALGLLKIDVLALGMLSAIRKSLNYVQQYDPTIRHLQDIPSECKKTYAMLSRGDSIGVFQVESRAQMNMLPRLQPSTFYDLVIEVAIVRPGPIQGDMVHPYLRRRQGIEPVSYPNDEVKSVLERTLGVPIFQEQVIKLAMVAAGFTGGQADQLRRAMASWRKNGQLMQFREPVINGMLERGHSLDFAERLFKQMQGFGDYGFPESHAASFALLVYFSAWLKCHHPAAFYCGLLNSQPMGFYSASQLIQDAQRHQVPVNSIDINRSEWDYTLEYQNAQSTKALRIGFRQVKGLKRDCIEHLIQLRNIAPFSSASDLVTRSKLPRDQVDHLISSGAFEPLDGHRRRSHWHVQGVQEKVLNQDNIDDSLVELTSPEPWDDLKQDFQRTGLTLRQHPLALLQSIDIIRACSSALQTQSLGHGRWVQIAGIVTCRQRPSTASGLLFLTLEDHTGNHNVIVDQAVQKRCRKALLSGSLLHVKGVIERAEPPAINLEAPPSVIHVKAGQVHDISQLIPSEHRSRDFH